MEQMRSEMSELKTLLGEQEIVNEKLIRRAMSTSYGKEKKSIRISIILATAAIPPACLLLPNLRYPIWFVAATVLFFLIAAIASCYSLKRYASEDLMNGDLTTVAETIVKYKRFGNNWLKFSMPFLILWLAGLFYYAIKGSSPGHAEMLIAGGATGAVAGTVLGIINYRQSRKRMKEILSQIEELKK